MRLALHKHKSMWLAVALIGWLTLAGPAAALTPEVKDEAGFFKPETVRKANETIKRIKQQHKKDLVIETFAHIPDGKEKEAVGADAKAREQFFRDWAVQRARESGVDGIYVLVCKEPSYLQIAVGNETRKRAFPDADRQALSKLMLDRFKEKQFDEGLLESVRLVQNTLQTNLAGAKAAEKTASDSSFESDAPEAVTKNQRDSSEAGAGWLSGPWGWLLIGGAVLLGVWLLVGLFRAFSGGVGGSGGGGFLSSLLGGLFGAAAGMWLYDTFFGGSEALAGEPGSEAHPVPDQDYSTGDGGDFGGGGDFDGDGSGGDF
jgi:uncharacterized membrane protein YgcG